jgi:hypothetical protein
MNWGVWVGYELGVGVAVLALTVLGLLRRWRVMPLNLESWVGLLVLAFFGALGLGQWMDGNFQAALVANGLASALIVSGAVNAAWAAGAKAAGAGTNPWMGGSVTSSQAT